MAPRRDRGSGERAPSPEGAASGLRLNRYLAQCGIASRRHAMEVVFAGRVTVNGEPAADPGLKIVSGRDLVEVDGERVDPPKRRHYLAFHKPRGVLVTARDELGRPSTDAFFRRVPDRVFPVGRLDKASEGLLLVTNDGDLADALLHPSKGIERTYRVRVTPRPRPEQLARLAQGVAIGGGQTSGPARVHVKRAAQGGALLTLTITEGKKREVRRMCRAVGLRVLRLRRVSFAGIHLDDLPPGAYRRLTREELDHLRRLTGLPL